MYNTDEEWVDGYDLHIRVTSGLGHTNSNVLFEAVPTFPLQPIENNDKHLRVDIAEGRKDNKRGGFRGRGGGRGGDGRDRQQGETFSISHL